MDSRVHPDSLGVKKTEIFIAENIEPRDVGCAPDLKDICNIEQTGYLTFVITAEKLTGKILRGGTGKRLKFYIEKSGLVSMNPDW